MTFRSPSKPPVMAVLCRSKPIERRLDDSARNIGLSSGRMYDVESESDPTKQP